MKNVELLSPVGSPDALAAALSEGADAVYLGLKTFNARLRSGNFTYAEFEAALHKAHTLNRKVYLTVNTIWTEREADRIYQLLKYVANTACDAVIVQDLGTLNLLKTCFPKLTVHASTQMNIASSLACNFLSKQGVSRVVLARELNLEQIQMIRAQTNIEIEVFVHGALCVSASGLCLFSSYLGGKSANRGMCTQACRRRYTAGDENKFYFNLLDIQLVTKVPALCFAGVNSFKIEGRMKNAEYVGVVTAAYRMVIDAVHETATDTSCAPQENIVLENAISRAQELLQGDFARKKTLFHFDDGRAEQYFNPETNGGAGIRLGTIRAVRLLSGTSYALIEDATLIPAEGDTIRLHRADDSARLSHKIRWIDPAGEQRFWADIPGGFGIGDSIYLIQMRAISKRYPKMLPRDLSSFTRRIGYDKAPKIDFDFQHADKNLPEGLYIAVQRPEDLYMVQSIRTEGVILHTDINKVKQLIKREKPLPYKPHHIILSFGPIFTENEGFNNIRRWVTELIDAGYTQFIINNLGHLALFKNIKNITLIAGPYMYAFNRQAAKFLAPLVSGIILPLENSRQNAERVFDSRLLRSRVFITVFAYPALFRIPSSLKNMYSFTRFTDRMGGEYTLNSGQENALVTPSAPFSITDKIPFLRTAGFRRFIIDFSPHPLRKSFYKDILRAAQDGKPVEGASRFNWKNGFFESAGNRIDTDKK